MMTRTGPDDKAATLAAHDADADDAGFAGRVRSAVFWRSGTQIVTQIISWCATLAVIRILSPADYGLFAMSQVILSFLTFLNGYGLISALVQSPTLDSHKLRQAFGIMLVMNGALALLQIGLAPWVAAYYRQPIVADMLRIQAIIYLATPFISIPEVLIGRRLDFKRTAFVNLFAGIVAAAVAITGAVLGWGVWTLVWAPIAGFWCKALGYCYVTRLFMLPSFDFRGTKPIILFAISMLGTQFFWLVQTQADVFIGGRYFTPSLLGLYSEALFLTQIFAAKFIPPLNDVAFPAFARMQHDKSRVAAGFARSIRMIMLVACPLYLGMAATAQPLVGTLFGAKWVSMAPYVCILALAMPFYALQVLFPTVCNAMGRPGVSTRIALMGAIIMPICYLVGVQFGVVGLACAWLFGCPILLAVTIRAASPVITITWRQIGAAVLPGLMASLLMAGVVALVEAMLPPMPVPAHLALLVIAGVVSYVGFVLLLARDTAMELVRLIRHRNAPESQAAA
jgi:O-antigen/teichoic acid export membrane protein